MRRFLLPGVCLVLMILIRTLDGHISYKGYKVVRVSVTKDADRQLVYEWSDSERIRILNEVYGGFLDTLISPKQYDSVLALLNEHSMQFKILNDDIGADLETEQSNDLRTAKNSFDFKSYHSVKDLYQHLEVLAKRHPGRCEIFSIGKSYEGRDLKAIRISADLRNSASKPMIWVDGGIHAREWVAHTTAQYIVDALLGEVEAHLTPRVEELLQTYQFVVLPMANPDGYEYSRTTDRLWRKTRKPSGCRDNIEINGECLRGRCFGSDPNRNFDVDFGKQGVSKNPCSDVYPGENAFSENNTQAMRDYLIKNIRSIKMYLSFHSYTQLFLKPVGYTQHPPPDATLHNKIGFMAQRALRSIHGKHYQNIRSVELYPNSGSSQDWIYHEGVKHAYTVELRDTGKYGFKLPANQIIPTGQENLNAFLVMVENI